MYDAVDLVITTALVSRCRFKVGLTRSSATAEKQRVSYACLSRLAKW